MLFVTLRKVKMKCLLLLVQFTGWLGVMNLGQQSGALSELSCKHAEDPLLGLLLSLQNLGVGGQENHCTG